MRIKRYLSLALVTAGLVAGIAAPSSASVLAPEPVNPGPIASETAARAELQALVGEQSPAELLELSTGREPATLLMDADTGKVIAAVETPATITPFAVSWTSPGCGTGSACVYANNGTSPNGFTGYGSSLQFSLSNVTKFYTGNRNTTIWRDLKYWAGAAEKTVYLSSAVNMTAISRS